MSSRRRNSIVVHQPPEVYYETETQPPRKSFPGKPHYLNNEPFLSLETTTVPKRPNDTGSKLAKNVLAYVQNKLYPKPLRTSPIVTRKPLKSRLPRKRTNLIPPPPIGPAPSAPFLPVPAPVIVYESRSGKPIPTEWPIVQSHGVYVATNPATGGQTLAIPRDRTPTPQPSQVSTVQHKTSGPYVMSRLGRNALSNSTGMNSRVVTAPMAKSQRINTANKPSFGRPGGGVVITHKELIGSLITSSTALAFNTTSFVLNPGNSATFPWLNSIASNFDKYRLKGVRVSLVSNQPTTTGGRMGVGYDFDSTDPPPADRAEFFSLTKHAECAPWDSVTLVVPVDNQIRFINSHTTTDSKLIDCGQIILMSAAVANAGTSLTSTVIADVIVEYSIELLEPQQSIMNSQIIVGANKASFDQFTVKGPVVAKMVYGSSTTVLDLQCPAGWYLYNVYLQDTGSGSPSCSVTINGGTGDYIGSGTTSQLFNTGVVNITANPGTIKLTFSGVTIANDEQVFISLTRISASVGSTITGAARTFAFGSTITTY